VRLRFWGVRGSIPTPGLATAGVGGNTACVSLELAAGVLVIDAGTGMRALGEALRGDDREVAVLFTHRHADHLHGLPFFAPLLSAHQPVHLLDLPVPEGSWSALEIFDGVYSPLRPANLAGTVERVRGDTLAWLGARGVGARALALRHPGGCTGYRIEEGGAVYAHLTDNELDGDDALFHRCADFCRGAAVLSHDAQYLSAEMERYRGRGHSSVERACDLALAAGVERLVLFHHDPDRSDAEIEQIERLARERVDGRVRVEAAREGMEMQL
jgi:phosphoribosyl 1,2-cyclic phosphodiesterase